MIVLAVIVCLCAAGAGGAIMMHAMAYDAPPSPVGAAEINAYIKTLDDQARREFLKALLNGVCRQCGHDVNAVDWRCDICWCHAIT